jgi:hypothetical protein
VDKQFFKMSTMVTVRNGAKARFWESAWLEGKAPRDLRKNRSVRDDLCNDNWTRGLWRMSDAEQMAELVTLWALILDVTLTEDEDTIRWKWTGNEIYTAKSAYKGHFVGSYCSFDSMAIWKSKTEGKCCFFAWLLVQRKILTADKLLARSWPCQPVCSLCDQEFESADHLCLQCVYAQEVWCRMEQASDGALLVPARNDSLQVWWKREMTAVSGKQKQKKASIMIYTTWNIWKERNRRILEGVSATTSGVVHMIKDEMSIRAAACCRDEVSND